MMSFQPGQILGISADRLVGPNCIGAPEAVCKSRYTQCTWRNATPNRVAHCAALGGQVSTDFAIQDVYALLQKYKSDPAGAAAALRSIGYKSALDARVPRPTSYVVPRSGRATPYYQTYDLADEKRFYELLKILDSQYGTTPARAAAEAAIETKVATAAAAEVKRNSVAPDSVATRTRAATAAAAAIDVLAATSEVAVEEAAAASATATAPAPVASQYEFVPISASLPAPTAAAGLLLPPGAFNYTQLPPAAVAGGAVSQDEMMAILQSLSEQKIDHDIQLKAGSMAAATAAVAVDKFEIAEGSTVTTERYKEVFTFHRVLGSGTFAATHLVTHKGTGKQFAFKAYIARASKDAELEIQVLKRVQSSSEAKTDRPDQVDSAVIRLHNWFIAHDYSIKRYILILELMAMPLNSVISGDQYTFSIQHLLRQMLTGLVELHTKKIVHGDIKPEHFMINILDKGVFKVKIIDFNLSELFSVPHAEGSSTSMTTAVGVRTPKECGNFGMKGTVGYRAPEILLKSNIHSYPVDIWALGVVFAEMVLRRYLIDIDLDDDQEDYHDATEIDILFSIVSCPSDKEWPEMVTSPRWSEDIRRNSTSKPFGGIAQELSIIGKDGMDLMSMMLKPNPDHRITAAEALRHPYLAA